MTLGDLLVLILFLTVAFFAGRITMMRSIVRAVIEEHENNSTDSERVLHVEKIGNVYYAYVNADFAGQASNFDDLFLAMSKNRKFNEWKISEFPSEFTNEERELMIQAIEKHFTKK